MSYSDISTKQVLKLLNLLWDWDDCFIEEMNEIFTLLEECNANPNVKSQLGEPILEYLIAAELEGSIQARLERFLSVNGVDINILSDAEESNALHMLALKSRFDDIGESISILVDKGIDINAQNRFGDTPIMILAEHGFGSENIETLLMTNRVDLSIKNYEGLTALDQARDGSGPSVNTDKVVELLEAYIKKHELASSGEREEPIMEAFSR